MIRTKLFINGIVQGVGFRPYIHKSAKSYNLNGWICNTSDGVELELEGSADSIAKFITNLKPKSPPMAQIDNIIEKPQDGLKNYKGFKIIPSRRGEKRNTLISPDVGICPDCARELMDPTDRRYRYPFINCTNCGPRFTIIKDIPYDREKTTMANFKMCTDCETEYKDIEDRRYHAQPDCCHVCGPHLFYTDADGTEQEGNAIELSCNLLKRGKILAIKGLGGFHLSCICNNPDFTKRLRQLKHRDEKPFAIMCSNTSVAEKLCYISESEKKLLSSPVKPILLLKKRNTNSLSYISENAYVGIMLPYTPIHCLIMKNFDMLVMTSANLSDMPIIYRNDEALDKLSNIADGFLMNNRDIHVRCDDSVLWCVGNCEYFVRRSRGYVPSPIRLTSNLPNILSCGAEQKASFGLTKDNCFFQSQHIGDLKNAETLINYENQIAHFKNIFNIEPEAVCCDCHPDYLSTSTAERIANEKRLPLYRIYHHHAHLCSCMADNGLDGNCIGITWDGVGYGDDGTSWGGEFLYGGYTDYKRLGTIRPIMLAGGDKAVKEIYRIGLALLLDSNCNNKVKFINKGSSIVESMIKKGINCPKSSGMGRLFDGVSSIIGIREVVSYEGQGAILLESIADEICSDHYYYKFYKENDLQTFDYRPMICEIISEVVSKTDASVIAAKFMNTLVHMAIQMCIYIRSKTGENRVCLSGGVFQNMYILKRITKSLCDNKFEVYCHKRVSTNDEGIALGQAAITARRMKNVSSSST